MDQSQQHDMDGNGYPGSMPRPYYPTEVPEQDPMVTPSAHTHNGNYTGTRLAGGQVTDSQSGLSFNQNPNQYLATSPEEFDKGYPYSRNILLQGASSSYESAVLTLQPKPQPSSQNRRMADPIQAEDTRILLYQQQDSYPVCYNCWRATWGPMESPGYVSASSSALPNCLRYPHVDGDSIYQADQRDVNPAMEWESLETNECFPQPAEESFPSNQQIYTPDPGLTTSDNEHFDASVLEQLDIVNSLQVPAAVTAIDIPVTVEANKDLPKKRKRKPRPVKPRKPRTLTPEGKAHAKAVRNYPGGACGYCKRKKTKARDPSVRNLVSTRL